MATNCSALKHPSWRFGNLQDNPHTSLEVGGDGEEVGNVHPVNRKTVPSRGSIKTSKGEFILSEVEHAHGKISSAAGKCGGGDGGESDIHCKFSTKRRPLL